MSSEDSIFQEVKINQSKRNTLHMNNIQELNNNSIFQQPKPKNITDYTQPNPITINNNIPELKVNHNTNYDDLSYAANILILIIGCVTFNPCLLLVNPCLKNNSNNENQKQIIILSVIFGIILGMLYSCGIFISVIFSILSINGNLK